MMKYIYIYDYDIKKDTYNKNYKNNYVFDDYDKFGFQLFNLIYAIYLHNLYNSNDNKCKLYYVFNKLNNIPPISNIFPDLKSKITFILNNNNSNNNSNNSNNNNNGSGNDDNNSINIVKLTDFPSYTSLNKYSTFNTTYNLTYKMYYTFTQNDKNIFLNFNEKIIIDIDKILFNLKNSSYSLINIIYSNKLSYLHKHNINNEIIVNSPNYYLNMILSKLSTNNIYVIITDSEDIVKQYINSKFKKKNIIIITNNNAINNLYLHLYANEIILETSPLCFVGAYFNPKATCYLNLIKRNNDYNFINNSIELSLSEHWLISYDKNNILNYDNYTIKSLLKLFTKNKILYETKENLELVNNFNFVYKNKIHIDYNNYFYRLIENKTVYNKNRINIQQINNTNKLAIEIYFDTLLNDNNVNNCLFITDDIFSITIDRLNIFSKKKIYIYYLNNDDIYILYKRNIITIDNYIALLFNLNRINLQVNISSINSLILYPKKSDYSIDYDFIYDYYIFYINKILILLKI